MTRAAMAGVLAALVAGALPAPAAGEPIQFKLLPRYSYATFKSDAPLHIETDLTFVKQ